MENWDLLIYNDDEIREIILNSRYSKHYWSWSSHWYHPSWVRVWDILMWDEHNTNNYTYIAINSVRWVEYKSAKQASTSWGWWWEKPRPVEWELIRICSYNGGLSKQWPWINEINKVLIELDKEIKINIEKEKEELENKKRLKEQELIQKDSELINNWK